MSIDLSCASSFKCRCRRNLKPLHSLTSPELRLLKLNVLISVTAQSVTLCPSVVLSPTRVPHTFIVITFSLFLSIHSSLEPYKHNVQTLASTSSFDPPIPSSRSSTLTPHPLFSSTRSLPSATLQPDLPLPPSSAPVPLPLVLPPHFTFSA